MTRALTVGSVCSGYGGAELAFRDFAEPAFMSEIEPFPRAILAHRFPGVKLHGDFTDLIVDPPNCDILAGGTPCQAFSVAGARRSLEDARGNLTLAFVMLLNSIDEFRRMLGLPPAVCLYENVPGLLSVTDNALGCFLAALVGHDQPIDPTGKGGRWGRAGLVVGPQRAAAWRITDAQYFGVAQRRRRVFVVASARKGFDPFSVLFEPEGVQRHSAPSREAGSGSAGDVAKRPEASSGIAHANAGEQVAIAEAAFDLAQITSHCNRSAVEPDAPAPTMSKASQMHAVAFGGNRTSGPIDVSPALNAAASGSRRMDFETEAFCVTGPITHTLKAEGADASKDGTGRGNPIVPCHAFDARQQDVIQYGDLSGPLDTEAGTIGVQQAGAAVRRLMPLECERLQGLPTSWTQIPWKGKAPEDCPDGPRYKAIGNGWAIPQVRFVARRLVAEIRRLDRIGGN